MRSLLLLEDAITNKKRKSNAAMQYHPARVILADGTIEVALFTESQVYLAIQRAKRNKEDFIDQDSWWHRFCHYVAWNLP